MILIDALCLCHRAKHSTGILRHGKKPTGVIYGVMNALLQIAKEFEHSSESIIWCWDHPKLHRYKILPSYKGTRRNKEKEPEEVEMDELARAQFKILRKKVLPALGFTNQLRVKGYEAEDLIARLCMELQGTEHITIVSADQDLWQLLTYADLYNPISKKMENSVSFTERWNIAPTSWGTVKAVAGCKSDDVPGVKGVGEVTAAKWVGTTLKRRSQAYKKIQEAAELINTNMKLTNLPFEGCPPLYETLEFQWFDFKGFKKICREYGFTKMLENRHEWKKTLEPDV